MISKGNAAEAIDAVIRSIKKLRKGIRLGKKITIKKMREQGRK